MNDLNPLFAWICVFSPLFGAALTPLLDKIHSQLRDLGAVAFPLLSAIAALMLLPALFHPSSLPIESSVVWISAPVKIGFGLLIDPLSIVVANVVAVISFIIMVYCLGYMKGDPSITRFWMWMNLFIGSMLLLVLSNNLLFAFVGWKMVGICSYGLIGFYYKDEKQYWIGGPPPARYVTPSHAGLKALVVTGIGDILMLGGILILFFYSRTLNLLELYETSSSWFPAMAGSPGLILLISVLLLAGPVGKSAQFPLHEWLPEAMAGPGPVSALIHAATMVKSGVYMVARFIPIFYYGYWAAGCNEASLFFTLTAWVGAITAFLAATQGMVSLELKKALAYSTVSQIGYMMLGLGVTGFSPSLLIGGYTSGIFHLLSHATFKACLFLCAGTVIHAAHSIYMQDMGSLRKYMPYTWLFMTIAALSLIGLPPLPGFWSKDAVLISSLGANRPLFILALITVALTSFYTIRFIGMVFHGPESENIKKLRQKGVHLGEGYRTMWISCGLLALMIIVVGIFGRRIEHFLNHGFFLSLAEELHLPIKASGHSSGHHIKVGLLSVTCLVIGAVPAYLLYIPRRINPAGILDKYSIIKSLHTFFRKRWFMDDLYYRIFVGGLQKVSNLVPRFVEDPLDGIYHERIPSLITRRASDLLKHIRTETRELLYNVMYVLVFFMIVIFVFLTRHFQR